MSATKGQENIPKNEESLFVDESSVIASSSTSSKNNRLFERFPGLKNLVHESTDSSLSYSSKFSTSSSSNEDGKHQVVLVIKNKEERRKRKLIML